jgi:hypothetical protein
MRVSRDHHIADIFAEIFLHLEPSWNRCGGRCRAGREKRAQLKEAASLA